jgi:hypothetical protein
MKEFDKSIELWRRENIREVLTKIHAIKDDYLFYSFGLYILPINNFSDATVVGWCGYYVEKGGKKIMDFEKIDKEEEGVLLIPFFKLTNGNPISSTVKLPVENIKNDVKFYLNSIKR